MSRVLTFTETATMRDRLFELASRGERPRGARLFALLDGARSRRIHPLVQDCRLPFRCLWDEPLEAPLPRVAPYLVEFDANAVFGLDVIARGFGRSWGVFVETATTLDALRAHLKTLLRVKDTAGRSLLFRFYDPRVLRLYLPTCTAAELRTIYGPIRRFFMEDERATAWLEFGAGAAGLEATTHPLGFLTGGAVREGDDVGQPGDPAA